MERHNISKNQLCNAANLQFTQLQSYYQNNVKRLDCEVLARICYTLECGLSDIVEYMPPEELGK